MTVSDSPEIIFACTAVLTLILFVRAIRVSDFAPFKNRWNTVLAVSVLWLVGQMMVASTGFYLKTETMPPHFIFAVLPPLIAILLFFILPKGRVIIDSLSLRPLAFLHVVRIPVEIVLWMLMKEKSVPQIMTFEGRNFDIVAGITMPLMGYLYFYRKSISRNLLLAWNFICLALLLNIVITAILSAPFPFQQLAFDQPNVAVLYFPFIWLPCFVVPVVLFAHLVSIRQLLKKEQIEVIPSEE